MKDLLGFHASFNELKGYSTNYRFCSTKLHCIEESDLILKKLFNRAKNKLKLGLDYLHHRFPTSNGIIQGSYNTGNVGDLAIGKTIKHTIEQQWSYSVELTGLYYSSQNFDRYKFHIIGGGGVIHDIYEGNIQKRLNPFGTATKNIVLGVGVPGFRTTQGQRLAANLGIADLITVRDPRSRERLKPYVDKKIHVTACPAFLMEPKQKNDSCSSLLDEEKDVCGINARNWFEPLAKNSDDPQRIPRHYMKEESQGNTRKKDTFINFLVKNLKNLKDCFNLVFIPFHRDDKYFAEEHLKPKLNIEILPVQNPQATLNTVFKVDQMVAMRYHSLIFSIIAQKPLFIISYLDKTDYIAEEFNFNHMKVSKVHEDEKFTFFDDIDHINEVRQLMKKKARKNFELLGKVLN